MTAEHARLSGLCEQLHTSFADICALEELALVGFMAGDPIDALRKDAAQSRTSFRAALVHALVAQEPRRNAGTVMVKELDSRRAFDHWLLPLLEDLERRKWRAEVHLQTTGERDVAPEWPAGRRWGPPRTPADVLERLADPERTIRNVILRVEGDHAGIWLALEAGLHRFSGKGAEPAHLHVTLVAQRPNLTESEWTPPGLDPPTPMVADTLAKGPALREHVLGSERVEIAGRTSIELALADYWPRFEEVALEHLLLFEREASLDRDAQLRPMLDDSFAEVRDLIRRGLKIAAIKLYRDITKASLVEAKNAVEAMESSLG